MPATALQHFKEDIARARAIVVHADPLPRTNDAEQLLRSDLLRSAWMFAVGALDAYYCDAYTDIVAATASSKSRQPAITLPEWVYDIKFPIRAVLEEYDNTNWRWRIHNCDRPRMSPQPLDKGGTVVKVIQDVEYFVHRSDEHITTEFREFLINVGCSTATIAQAGY